MIYIGYTKSAIQGPDGQAHADQRRAAELGVEISAWASDTGSGLRHDHPGLKGIFESGPNGGTTIIVARIDRLSRSLTALCFILRKSRRLCVRIENAHGTDLATAVARDLGASGAMLHPARARCRRG